MDTNDSPAFGLTLRLDTSFKEAVTQIKSAFKEEGFGVLTEMNVQQTLQDKIGFQMEPYLVLGMCNPTLASRAITEEPNIGLFLPCNVLVAQRGNQVEVCAQDPLFMVPITGNAALQPIAEDARQRMDRALARLKM